jgi:hypothetical protein
MNFTGNIATSIIHPILDNKLLIVIFIVIGGMVTFMEIKRLFFNNNLTI